MILRENFLMKPTHSAHRTTLTPLHITHRAMMCTECQMAHAHRSATITVSKCLLIACPPPKLGFLLATLDFLAYFYAPDLPRYSAPQLATTAYLQTRSLSTGTSKLFDAMTQNAGQLQNSPSEDPQTWSGWFSSMANSAYKTVVGTAPESYQDLAPTTALTSDADPAAPSKEFGNVDAAARQALWRQLATVVGMDVNNMRISLPVWLFEPTTALSRMVETFEYSDLLDRAATCHDPVLRDCLVAAFVVSAFSHTERVRKPFNPVLGETYEYINPVNDMKFYAEQVSHHPPISVSHVEGKGWTAGEVVDISATYQGNAVEIANVGSRFIHLTGSNDRYSWNLPKALVSNLFVGGAFVDHFGVIELHNETSGTKTILDLSKCGWFSAGRYEVTGELLDATGNRIVIFRGAWNKYLDCERVAKAKGEGTNRLWMAGSHLLSEEEGGGATGSFSSCTKFTKKALALDPDYTLELPPTDSRLRPDRIALEKGDRALAAEEKLRIEQLQRERRAATVAAANEGDTQVHTARYFRKVSETEQVWEPKGNYWTESRSFTGTKREETSLW